MELALGADLVCEPGSRTFYNNKAVDLLAPIVLAASGRRLDAYVRDEIFAPMGIREFEWAIDPVGHPQCMAGLVIRPEDLAKIGQMMLDGGTWQGRRIVSPDWIARSTSDAAARGSVSSGGRCRPRTRAATRTKGARTSRGRSRPSAGRWSGFRRRDI